MTAYLHITWLLFFGIALVACRAADPPPRDDFDQQLANQLPDASYETRQKVRILLGNTIANLSFIKGGTFIMGDWGAIDKDGSWKPYSPANTDENKAHQVTLSSYSLSKHKITWEEYDTFLLATNRPTIIRASEITHAPSSYSTQEKERLPYDQDPSNSMYIKNPANDRWEDAKAYCLWLSDLTGVPFDLPTNAQFEYASRNRGLTTWLYPTHDGKPIVSKFDPFADRVFENGWIGPVGTRLPANPLGIFDLAENRSEWVNDWYSPSYYSENPEITDPQGPSYGEKKTVRSLGLGSLSFSFSRIGSAEREGRSLVTNGFRCAVNSPKPVVFKIPE